ncbi:MAG: spherulation-specific family 4 protein [Nitrososphaerales archaeon]
MNLKILPMIVFLFAVLAPVSFGSRLVTSDSSTHSSNVTGIIIPLYSYPNADWQTVVQEKESNPSVPMVAVINPNNGPGYAIDPNFVAGIQALKAAGILVLGYVPTSYGGRSSADVISDITTYASRYQVNGIFFDEMASVSGYESYYSGLSSYAKSLGMTLTVGNPGTGVPSSYIGTVDNMVIYENSGLPTSAYLGNLGYQKNDFSVISYDNSYVNASFLASVSQDVGYIYLTDGVLPSPYFLLPSFFQTLVSMVSQLDSSVSGTPTISVQAVDLSGNPIQGIWTTFQTGGLTVQQGFTPATFSPPVGDLIAVSVGNFGNYLFDHWAEGSFSNTLMVNASGSTTLLAVYRPSSISLSVIAIDSEGNPISGLWVTAYFGGNLLLSGYTPLTFQGASGSSYTISISNYGSYQFSHWSTGSTNPSVTIIPQYSMTIQADY